MLLLLYTLFLTSVMSAVVDYDVWDPVIRVELENNHRRQEPFKILKYVRENKAEVEKEMKEHHIGRIGHRFPMENFMPLRGRSFMTSAFFRPFWSPLPLSANVRFLWTAPL